VIARKRAGTWSRGLLFSGATDHIAGVDNATQSEAQPPIVGRRVGRPWRQRLEDLLTCEEYDPETEPEVTVTASAPATSEEPGV